jgi:hypothetical protein
MLPTFQCSCEMHLRDPNAVTTKRVAIAYDLQMCLPNMNTS